jgi:ribosomal protein L27
MAGGKSTPKKDKAIKVSNGQAVKTGQILCRGLSTYKAGINVKGMSTLFALCPGKIYFSKKKTSHGKIRTFINIAPITEKTSQK